MKINEFPDIGKYLPIDIEKCEKYWNEKINGIKTGASYNDWADCKRMLEYINDTSLPVTLRTYWFVVRIPFIITNYIIETHGTK